MKAIQVLRRVVAYDPPDAVQFWRGRASDPGWHSVMWANAAYNACAHADQWKEIVRNLPERRRSVLDLGCGTGRFSAALSRLFDEYVGVDLDTMVAEARRRNPLLADRFVAARAQDFAYPRGRFDLVLSMACLASACAADELPETASRITRALRPGGRVILVDPFHRTSLLARTCRMSGREVIRVFEDHGIELVEWTGIHFAPVRLVLAGRRLGHHSLATRATYHVGELINAVAARALSDYKVIVLQNPECGATVRD